MTITVHHVDAFAASPFTGNPAAVCLLEQPADAQWMGLVARELNLPMTAFVHGLDDGFALRWFTPQTEVDLCGHATLASAHVLWQCGAIDRDARVRFLTRGGMLSADLEDDLIVLEFPAAEFRAEDAPSALLTALGASPIAAGRFEDKRLLEVASESELRALSPDFDALRALDEKAVVVTCRSQSADIDFVSRNFAPWIGIDEDAVTGSSHCCLGPYWAERLDKTTMHALQASSRGGHLRIQVVRDRVRIGGRAVIVASGELRV